MLSEHSTTMASLTTPMSEPNAVPLVPPLALDLPAPAESDNGSPTPTNTPVPLPPTTPQIAITFLVISGRRRTMSFDPASPLGRVKELVWLSWPPDWSDDRPPAPNYLRILYLGRLLQDDDVLESIHNPLAPMAMVSSPTTTPAQPPPMIMHLSIRPVPPASETNDLKKKRKRMGRSASNASGASADPGPDNDGSSCCPGCIIC